MSGRPGRAGPPVGSPRALGGWIIASALVAGVLAACAGQPTPGWTYGPTVAPAAAASGVANASPAATSALEPTSSAAPAASGGGALVDITARNIAFQPTTLTAPANQPLTLHFDNEDAGIPHDVSIRSGSASGTVLFTGDTVTGVGSTDYQVGALPPGTYTIICTIHPTQMVATLTVK